MKKVLFILMLMVSLGILMAVESAPSETVGYFKLNIAQNSYEAISLPFGYPVLTPDAVLGTQFTDNDMIIDMVTSANAIYITGAGWLGDITEMVYGHTYWVFRDLANPPLEYFILGTVNPSPVTLHVRGVDQGSWSPFALNEAQPIDITTLPITGVADSDIIIDIKTAQNAMYLDGVGWIGDLLFIEPTHAYWYNSYSATSYDWTYTPVRGVTASPLRTSK